MRGQSKQECVLRDRNIALNLGFTLDAAERAARSFRI